jgi:predicted ArsR family transcriptional regulator
MTPWRGIEIKGELCNLNACIRRILSEGPATSLEIADSLGVARNQIRKSITTMRVSGYIRPDCAGYRKNKIYSLTPRGLATFKRRP